MIIALATLSLLACLFDLALHSEPRLRWSVENTFWFFSRLAWFGSSFVTMIDGIS